MNAGSAIAVKAIRVWTTPFPEWCTGRIQLPSALGSLTITTRRSKLRTKPTRFACHDAQSFGAQPWIALPWSSARTAATAYASFRERRGPILTAQIAIQPRLCQVASPDRIGRNLQRQDARMHHPLFHRHARMPEIHYCLTIPG